MRKIAVISEYASPLALVGSIDSGGQNVYVAHLARQLARLGYLVDIFTRSVGGIKSTVLDGHTGYLVPPEDPLALARCLAHLQREPELRERLGQNGLRRARRLFTWRRVALQIDSAYRSVLNESSRTVLRSQNAVAAPDITSGSLLS